VEVSDIERERREHAVSAVIHSGRLEGFDDNHKWQTMMRQFADGHITREELRASAHQPRNTSDGDAAHP
jgi:hypothetical protein